MVISTRPARSAGPSLWVTVSAFAMLASCSGKTESERTGSAELPPDAGVLIPDSGTEPSKPPDPCAPQPGQPSCRQACSLEVSAPWSEVAQKLALALWGDPTLAPPPPQDATDGVTSDEVRSLAREMLKAPEALSGVARFAGDMLLANARSMWGDLVLSDEQSLILPEMQEEAASFTYDVLNGESPTLRTLLTAPFSFLNDRLVEHYAVESPPAPGFRRVDFSPEQKSGLFTQGLFLTLTSSPGRAAWARRGRLLASALQCHLVPRPGGVDVDFTELATASRQEVEASLDPACQVCHVEFGVNVGFAFDHYDTLGRYRATDDGQPIDTSGLWVSELQERKAFSGVEELMQILVPHWAVTECQLWHLLAAMLGRSADFETVKSLRDLEAWNGPFAERVVGSVQSEDARAAYAVLDEGRACALIGQADSGELDLREAIVTMVSSPAFLDRSRLCGEQLCIPTAEACEPPSTERPEGRCIALSWIPSCADPNIAGCECLQGPSETGLLVSCSP